MQKKIYSCGRSVDLLCFDELIANPVYTWSDIPLTFSVTVVAGFFINFVVEDIHMITKNPKNDRRNSMYGTLAYANGLLSRYMQNTEKTI